MKKTMTTNTINLTDLFYSLASEDGFTAQAKLTNAQKNWELRQAIKELFTQGENTALQAIEESIQALPQGKLDRVIFDDKTGKTIIKQYEPRDNIKKCVVRAFNKEKVALGYSEHYVLKFTLSSPMVEEKDVVETSLKSKVAKLLGDTVDNKGLQVIMSNIEKVQMKHRTSISELASKSNQRLESARLASMAEQWQGLFIPQDIALSLATVQFASLDSVTILEAIANCYERKQA